MRGANVRLQKDISSNIIINTSFSFIRRDYISSLKLKYMSNEATEIWLENRVELGYALFQEGEFEQAEAIVKELREMGYEKEANKLEQDLNEEKDLRFAQEKGSEAGVDEWQDKE